MLDLTQPFFSNLLNLVPSAPVQLATAVSLGDLQSGQIGSIVPRPTVIADGSYTSVTWQSSDYKVLDIATQPDGIKLVGPGKATLTVTLNDVGLKPLATVSKEYTVTVPVVPPAPPVITKQPGIDTNLTGKTNTTPEVSLTPYLVGTPAKISAATATVESGATLTWQWQKLAENGTDWADIQNGDKAELNFTAPTEDDEGVYRVLAVAGNAGGEVSTASEPVYFWAAFIFLQNDSHRLDQAAHRLTVTKADNGHYAITPQADDPTIGLSGYVRRPAKPNDNIMAAPHFDSVTSDKPDVCAATIGTGRAFTLDPKAAGEAHVSVQLSNLLSILTVTVS